MANHIWHTYGSYGPRLPAILRELLDPRDEIGAQRLQEALLAAGRLGAMVIFCAEMRGGSIVMGIYGSYKNWGYPICIVYRNMKPNFPYFPL